MGVDWVRKAEERFRHQLQDAASSGFTPTPLFVPEEEETVTYPCHWLYEDKTLPVGTRLTIFNRSDRARILVLHNSEGVAEVRGEAARDLQHLFMRHSELHNVLPVTIVRVGEPAEPFYVEAFTAVRKRAKAAR